MDEQPVEQTAQENATTEQPKQEEPKQESQTQPWGDSRMNPLFLKVADYFGITEKTYRIAVGKVNEIIDWATVETNSKNPSDVILKIAETSKSLQSPGYGEHPWAILHRYIRLLNEVKPIDKNIKSLEAKKADVQKEMKAYEHAIT